MKYVVNTEVRNRDRQMSVDRDSVGPFDSMKEAIDWCEAAIRTFMASKHSRLFLQDYSRWNGKKLHVTIWSNSIRRVIPPKESGYDYTLFAVRVRELVKPAEFELPD